MPRKTIKSLESQIEHLENKLVGAHQALLDEEAKHEKVEKKLREDRAALMRERDDLKDRLKLEQSRTRQGLEAAEEGSTAAGLCARVNLRLMDHVAELERLLRDPGGRRR